MKRYTLNSEYRESEVMDCVEDGEWVRYEDFVHALAIGIAGKEAAIEAMKKDVEFYKRHQRIEIC